MSNQAKVSRCHARSLPSRRLTIQRRKIAETLQNDFTEILQYCMWWLRNVTELLLQNSNNVKMSAFCYIATKHSSNIAI